ncbi:hypothetical protein LOTGIDRAFT_165355 [Lottia gigantea]|uniref:Uncharacterized protein n=1 Tax=Lottia gigantea TaxID=225164 RepID=V3ZW23_LOTGI|nr:hypothetical protein LOTGIDRAFT_165355 [Lottia gigantea]ESO88572.1 hypothetical protein LOTGIDRAFT_165355 [Lottia gigantea]
MESLLRTYRTSFNPMTNGFVCYLHSLLGVHNKYECAAKEVLYLAESNGVTYTDSVANLAHRIRGVCVTVNSLAKVNFDMNKLQVFLNLEFELHAPQALVPTKGKSTLISKTLCTKLSLIEVNIRLTKVNNRLSKNEKRLRIKLTQAQRTNVANNKEVNLLRTSLNIRPSNSQTFFYKNKVEELNKSLDQQEKRHNVALRVSDKRHELKIAAMSREMTKLKEQLHMAYVRRIELLEKGIIDIDNSADQIEFSEISKNSSLWNIRRKHATSVSNITSDCIPESTVTTSICPGTGNVAMPSLKSINTQSTFHIPTQHTGSNPDSSSSHNSDDITDTTKCSMQLSTNESSGNYNPPTAYGEHNMKVKLENEDDFKIKVDPLDNFEYETAIESGVATMSDSWNYFDEPESHSVNPADTLLKPDEIKKENDIEVTGEPDNRILTPDEIKKERDEVAISEETDCSQDSFDASHHGDARSPANVERLNLISSPNLANQVRPNFTFTTQNPEPVSLATLDFSKTKVPRVPAKKGRPRKAYSLLNNPHSESDPTGSSSVEGKPSSTEGEQFSKDSTHAIDISNTVENSSESQSSSNRKRPTPVALYSSGSFQDIIRKKLSSGCTTVRIKTKRKHPEDDSSTFVVKKKNENSEPQFRFISVKNIADLNRDDVRGFRMGGGFFITGDAFGIPNQYI